jgi:DNA-3-methyladenine glycosylase I
MLVFSLFATKIVSLLFFNAFNEQTGISTVCTPNNNTCPWVDLTKSDYVAYHDEEWGIPVLNDTKLFECLCLESAQAGLSWYTILRKRQGYREAFLGFDINKVAAMTTADEHRLVLNNAIVRHKGKISAFTNNARCILAIQKEYSSFTQFLWSFTDNKVLILNNSSALNQVSTCPISDRLSQALKKRGFKFVGSTTLYAFLQAVGIFNGHDNHCSRKTEIINSYKDLGLIWKDAGTPNS